jgi:hypothetical protein
MYSCNVVNADPCGGRHDTVAASTVVGVGLYTRDLSTDGEVRRQMVARC